MTKSTKNSKRKFPLCGKILFSLLIIVALGTGIAIGTVYKTLSKLNNVDISNEDLGIVAVEELEQYDNYKKITNIALFGIDSEDGVGRSDSIMVATIDPVHDKLKITSIMRDSYVNIDGHGYDKINHAYAFGKAPLAIKTINESFGLNIQDFVAVDFNSLPYIIDLLGGIELNITNEELNYINFYINEINSLDNTTSLNITTSGLQHVDGVQALAYSRIRYTSGGDYERTQRQRTVLNALFDKALNISPTKYLNLINDILPHVQTSLSANDILSLATKVVTMGGGSLEQERFPRDEYCQGEMINGVYYLTFDEATTKQQMMNYIFDDKK
ncbi:LCP family protein [Clostridium saudiense]|uniref:LCP family protein n=1 Tax=Clostridium saudiense TaxID=1414720 RepID=UPI00319E845B